MIDLLVNRLTMVANGHPTQRDVALRAGVSTATVSYILSGRRARQNSVSPDTEARVLAAARDLGYQRNQAARSLRRQRTEFVCLVFRPPTNPWMDRLAEQLHDAAVQHDCSMMMLPAGPGRTDSALRVLRERYVDGAIVILGQGLPGRELAALARNGLSLVAVGDDLAPDGFDVVRQDQLDAVRAAMSHLVRRGHRRIAYLGHGEPGRPPEDDARLAGYRRALGEHGLPFDPALAVAAADSRSAGYRAASELLSRADRPTALFSASDRAAIAAIWAAERLGLSIPDDVAVVGTGNIDEGTVVRPTLTSIGLPTFDFMPVVDRLFARITADRALAGIELRQPWQLVLRESA